MRARAAIALAAAVAALGAARTAPASLPAPTLAGPGAVRILTVWYRAHNGDRRRAFLLLPRWYGPHRHPPLPLVISPHGRGVDALRNVSIWGDLPARGPFAVVNPEGQGRRLRLYSWGDPGQIADLARLPSILRRALPWLEIDASRIYAFGGSMGGQEVLLLAARHPHLLAGAAAFDAPTDLAERYYRFDRLRRGRRLQRLIRSEVGGTPRADPAAYAARSPLRLARRLARSGVPLEIWWSRRDRVVVDERDQSGLLCREIRAANPHAPLLEVVGNWAHTHELRWNRRLPSALRRFGLLPTPQRRAARAASTSSGVL